MKFDEKFPNAVVNDEPQTCLVLFAEIVPCVQCQTPTGWVDLDFQAHICGEECLNDLIMEFMAANEAAGPIDDE